MLVAFFVVVAVEVSNEEPVLIRNSGTVEIHSMAFELLFCFVVAVLEELLPPLEGSFGGRCLWVIAFWDAVNECFELGEEFHYLMCFSNGNRDGLGSECRLAGFLFRCEESS